MTVDICFNSGFGFTRFYPNAKGGKVAHSDEVYVPNLIKIVFEEINIPLESSHFKQYQTNAFVFALT